MTQEIKLKLEQAAIKCADRDQVTYYPARASYFDGFTSAAQTILENPSEWGLMPILDSMDHIEESDQNWSEVVDSFKAMAEKYREALESIDYYLGGGRDDLALKIAKEALKQQ